MQIHIHKIKPIWLLKIDQQNYRCDFSTSFWLLQVCRGIVSYYEGVMRGQDDDSLSISGAEG